MKEEIKVLIVDDDAAEAHLLSCFLIKQHYNILTTPTIYLDVVKRIEDFLPDVIIISMNHAEEDIEGLKIVTYIHHTFNIPVLLLVEYHEHENLQQYIKTEPFSCYFKSIDKSNEQILNELKFSEPHIVGKLCKYKAKIIRVIRLDIDEKDEPVSYEGMEHHFEDKEIKLCDVLYFKAGSAHIKNFVLIRLQSDKNHYYAFRDSLVQVLVWLNYRLFTHINGSYIINNEKITAWNIPLSVTVDDIVITIGRNNKDDIIKAYNYYHPKE